MLSDGSVQLDALGDPSRRAILDLLAVGPASVGRLADALPISRPAVSQHLAVLKAAALVRDEAQGTRRVYSLDDTGFDRVRVRLGAFWRAELDEFARAVERHLDADS